MRVRANGGCYNGAHRSAVANEGHRMRRNLLMLGFLATVALAVMWTLYTVPPVRVFLNTADEDPGLYFSVEVGDYLVECRDGSFCLILPLSDQMVIEESSWDGISCTPTRCGFAP